MIIFASLSTQHNLADHTNFVEQRYFCETEGHLVNYEFSQILRNPVVCDSVPMTPSLPSILSKSTWPQFIPQRWVLSS